MRLGLPAFGIASIMLASCGNEGAPPPASTGPDLVTCVGPTFPAETFDAPADAEMREGAEGNALRQAIKGEPFGDDPPTGWRELGRTEDEVAFAAGEPPVLGGYVVLRRNGEEWVYSQSGSSCIVQPYRKGFTMARWGLHPDAAPVSASTDALDVLANDQTCASGVGPEERLTEPAVEVTPQAIIITFASRPPDGAQNCASHPPARRQVQLPEPLGNRDLLDGGLYPPQPPCQVERGDCVNDRR